MLLKLVSLLQFLKKDFLLTIFLRCEANLRATESVGKREGKGI